MKNKQLLYSIGAFGGILILILDGQTALQGAYSGIEMCIKTVIPSLFPFITLSILLTSSLPGLNIPFLRSIGKVCGIPQGAESVLLSGFLGGYPVGAQCVAEAYRIRMISKQDAQRMIAFCSNAGPAFLFGMISPMFPHPGYAWALWGIHVASALLVGVFFPQKQESPVTHAPKESISITDAVQRSLRAMACICGWVVLFRVVISFLFRWFLWLLPIELQVLIVGILELSNGCVELSGISDLCQRFSICSICLSLGGVCVVMQTASVAQGLSIRTYLQGKLVQTLISIFLCGCIFRKLRIVILLFPMILLWILLNRKNSGRIQPVVSV